jgi:hypothetical protein
MTATKTDSRDFNVQVLEDTVRGVFAGKNALAGSALATAGAIIFNSRMPYGGPDWIGNEITIPYFGTLGDFADNPEDTAAVPKVLKSTNEKATIARSSLAFEVTRWAQHSGPTDADPYEECARQIQAAAVREMDRLCIAKAVTTPLKKDVYNASTPVYLDWDTVTDARAMFGDEQEGIVGLVVHSRTESGMRKLRDSNGRPLLVDSMRDNEIPRFNGIPLVVSDRMPLTGSSMGTVTETGAAVGGVGLTGTPTGAWSLKIKITLGGARGTAKFQFSTDGGNTWSAEFLTAATVVLTDTATDSLVGNNGDTGLTATFGVATYDVLSVYASNAILKASSLILQRDALTFWYSAANMGLETDKDILKHNDIAAMHMYRVAHLYRRRRGGTKPGAALVQHNVQGFVS